MLFGSCKFGDAQNLIEVLRPSKVRGETVQEPADLGGGYGEEIDYTRSSLFDIYFYDLLFRTNGGDEIARLETTVERLKQDAARAGREPVALDRRQGCRTASYRDIIQDEVDIGLRRRAEMASFTGFGPKALPFFEALKFHQSKEWFEENRGALRERRARADGRAARRPDRGLRQARKIPLRADGKRSIFRLHRDVRFAKDKSPYKTHAGAVMTRSGSKKDQGLLYIHIDPEGCFAAAGFYMPEAAELLSLRREGDQGAAGRSPRQAARRPRQERPANSAPSTSSPASRAASRAQGRTARRA